MRRHWQGFLAAIVAALVVAVPLLYSSHRQTTIRNFHVVEDGKLYRSGQLSPPVFERTLDEYGIKTVVTLRTVRTAGMPYPDEWEAGICAGRHLKHIRLVPRVWGPDEKGTIPADENVAKFLEIMDCKENQPVLVHCFAGIHRTGTMCAIFRMEYHHWTANRAIEEMQVFGFDPADMHEHIDGYLRGYRHHDRPQACP
jgi:tyrosine-protein phosphatase SIW14